MMLLRMILWSLKREVMDKFMEEGIYKFILIS